MSEATTEAEPPQNGAVPDWSDALDLAAWLGISYGAGVLLLVVQQVLTFGVSFDVALHATGNVHSMTVVGQLVRMAWNPWSVFLLLMLIVVIKQGNHPGPEAIDGIALLRAIDRRDVMTIGPLAVIGRKYFYALVIALLLALLSSAVLAVITWDWTLFVAGLARVIGTVAIAYALSSARWGGVSLKGRVFRMLALAVITLSIIGFTEGWLKSPPFPSAVIRVDGENTRYGYLVGQSGPHIYFYESDGSVVYLRSADVVEMSLERRRDQE